jgi:hypothetical protein
MGIKKAPTPNGISAISIVRADSVSALIVLHRVIHPYNRLIQGLFPHHMPIIRALFAAADKFQHIRAGIGPALNSTSRASQKIPSITKMLFRTLPP